MALELSARLGQPYLAVKEYRPGHIHSVGRPGQPFFLGLGSLIQRSGDPQSPGADSLPTEEVERLLEIELQGDSGGIPSFGNIGGF